jgi:hypothetical protein
MDLTHSQLMYYCWTFHQLINIKVVILANAINIPNMQTHVMADLVTVLSLIDLCNYYEYNTAWFTMNDLLYDISPVEDSHVLLFVPHKGVRHGSLDWSMQKLQASFEMI